MKRRYVKLIRRALDSARNADIDQTEDTLEELWALLQAARREQGKAPLREP